VFIFTYKLLYVSHLGCHIMYCISSVCLSSCVSHADIKLVDEQWTQSKNCFEDTHCVIHRGHASFCYWILKSLSLLHSHQIVSIVMWFVWKNVSTIVILLSALGWDDECQLLYHKWWSWWNTQSYAACCCTGDSQLDSVNICLLSCS